MFVCFSIRWNPLEKQSVVSEPLNAIRDWMFIGQFLLC